MVESKGALLEEVASTFFRNSGHYTLRSVLFRFGDEDVTDVDTWTYLKKRPNVIVKGVVDVKNKRSPKAFERILWVSGLRSALDCDEAAVVTTENNPTTGAFASRIGVSVIPKAFLAATDSARIDVNRVTHEQFMEEIRANPGSKSDGDWAGILSNAKSRLISQGGFPAFNRAMFAMKFFGDRLEVRHQHKDCALRCALMVASIACVSLDMAMNRMTYDTQPVKFKRLIDGITYGDDGDGHTRQGIDAALSVIAEASRNGRTIAAQARADLDRQLDSIRADIIAEYFMRDVNAAALFLAALEFEALAHSVDVRDSSQLSIATRSILGIFSDYLGIPRTALPIAKERYAANVDAVAGAPSNESTSAPRLKDGDPEESKPTGIAGAEQLAESSGKPQTPRQEHRGDYGFDEDETEDPRQKGLL